MTLLLDRRPSSHPDVRSDATRREFIVGGVAAGLLTAAGCGSGRNVDATSPQPSATDGTFPVVVEHAYGETEITGRAQRVVSVGFNDQDPILALGVIPAGVMQWYEDHPTGFFWTQERYGDRRPETVNGAEFLEINFERVASLRPDLIVGVSGLEDAAYQTLSRIAPTLPQAPGEGSYSSAPWQMNQRMVGRALGLADQAETVIADVEAQVAMVRREHSGFEGSTVVVAEVFEGQFAVRGSSEVWSEFLTDLGFRVPGELVGADYTEISSEFVERFGDLDALVWLGTPEKVDGPLYRELKVAREGRHVFVESVGELSGAIGFNSALSLPVVIDRLVPKLAAAIDGDPATEETP